MKTFGLFMLLWLVFVLASFNIWKNSSIEALLKMIMATQLAYIVYRLLKEADKEL
jgi:hypothetical protein